jgi:hypothetical protein
MQVVEWEISGRAIPYWIGHDCGSEIAGKLRALETDQLVVVAEAEIWRRFGGALRDAGNVRAVLIDGGEGKDHAAKRPGGNGRGNDRESDRADGGAAVSRDSICACADDVARDA